MERLLAVVKLTWRESIRKRIFLIILIFVVILISLSAVFPVVKMADRVKLVETWALRGISLFGILMAIFLAAVSIPNDIEDKKFFSVFTKPITRGTFILGRLLGFILVSGAFVFLMGFLSLLYIRIVALASATKEESPLVLREKIKPVEFGFVQKQNINGRLSGTYSEDKKVEVKLSGAIENNYAGWKFKGLKLSRLSNPVKAELKVKLGEGKFGRYSKVRVQIYNPLTKEEKIEQLHLKYGQPKIIEFDPSLISQTGEVLIRLARTKANSYLDVNPESVLLISAPRSFEWNFLKGLTLIFFKVVLILVLVVAASTFLSSGINILLGIFVCFSGSLMGFFQDSLESMKYTMTRLSEDQALQTVRHVSEPLPLWSMQISEFVLDIALKILPDFQMFNGTTPLLKGSVISGSLFSNALIYLVPYCAIAIVIAWICFKTREFK